MRSCGQSRSHDKPKPLESRMSLCSRCIDKVLTEVMVLVMPYPSPQMTTLGRSRAVVVSSDQLRLGRSRLVEVSIDRL